MDLRRRNKQHVMETMDGKTPAPRAHEFACAHGDELPTRALARIAWLAGILLIAALIY